MGGIGRKKAHGGPVPGPGKRQAAKRQSGGDLRFLYGRIRKPAWFIEYLLSDGWDDLEIEKFMED
jgi:hypothetical protein